MEHKAVADKQRRTVPIVLLVILLILFFILPILLEVYDSNINVLSVTWILFYNLETSSWSIMIWNTSTWGLGATLSILRLAFILQTGRYFAGKTTKARTLLLGLLAELQMTIPYYLLMIYSVILHGLNPYSFILPTPIFLISGWLFMRINPPESQEKSLDWFE